MVLPLNGGVVVKLVVANVVVHVVVVDRVLNLLLCLCRNLRWKLALESSRSAPLHRELVEELEDWSSEGLVLVVKVVREGPKPERRFFVEFVAMIMLRAARR